MTDQEIKDEFKKLSGQIEGLGQIMQGAIARSNGLDIEIANKILEKLEDIEVALSNPDRTSPS